MNIFNRLFKKKEFIKRIQEVNQKTNTLNFEILGVGSPDLKFDKDDRYRVKEINKLPKLTKSELIALQSCIDFTLSGAKTIGVEHNLRKAIYMKRLTDKGYLVRIMKGHYTLNFYK